MPKLSPVSSQRKAIVLYSSCSGGVHSARREIAIRPTHEATRPETSTELASSTRELASFTEELFGHLPRRDQRRWAHACLEGLLTAPGRKSVHGMAAVLPAHGGSCAATAQSLHRFINCSPWQWDLVYERLIHWTERRVTPRAWTVGTVLLPKRGLCSVGVHRYPDPAGRRSVNAQLGLGMFLSTGTLDIPVDWRLHLHERWCDDHALRRRARIPETVRHRPPWAHIVELAGALAARTGLAPAPVVVELPEHGDTGLLAAGLSRQGLDFMIAVPGSLAVLPMHRGSTATPLPASRLVTPGGSGTRTITGVSALGRARSVQVVSEPVRLAGAGGRGGRHGYRLIAEARGDAARPPRVWLTNLVHRGPAELLDLVGPSASAVRRLGEFGLLDFEGRSYPGWHHHMALVSAAYAYHRLDRGAAG
ncbi:transposase [Streptomyces sp. NPDC029004]|uniref:IS701 family transposase n=1 Tax=Streptomyces sp. NPDC029004 TaxID=3154490 RepID=UPI0033F872A0